MERETQESSKKVLAPVVFGRQHHCKWFGLSLTPYCDAYRDDLVRLYAPHFGERGDVARLEPLVRKYSAGIFAIARLTPAHGFEVIGFTAFLPLSSYGVRLIEFSLFDGHELEEEALADGYREAAALYWWATVAEGAAFRALPLVELALSQPPFAGKDIFATAGTTRGLHAMQRLGFAPVRFGEEPSVGSLVVRRMPSVLEEAGYAN